VDSWRTPLVVVQGVIEWSVRHFLVLCRVGRNTCQSMFNMVLLLSEFWATLYIGRMEVFFLWVVSMRILDIVMFVTYSL
jgi:hypothetical protein